MTTKTRGRDMRQILALMVLTAGWFWAFPIANPHAFAAQDAARAGAPISGAATPGEVVRLSEVGAGSLLLQSVQPGFYVEAPIVATDVKMDVTGPIVRARVTQRFENPSDQWVEGVYVFPLPDGAGVDTLKLIIGDRFIEGDIKEREEARVMYEAARAEGKKAALVEQERPNIFTNSVANIGPGETVVVQIEYQDTAALKDGVFSTRFPMVVAPRYIPDPSLVQMVSAGGQRAIGISDPVPDADRITPPVLKPEAEPQDAPRLPVTMTINLATGFKLGQIDAPYHAVSVDRQSNNRAEITLSERSVPANRDFALEWAAEDTSQPHAAVFTEERDGETYVLAMLTPPAGVGETAPRRPREAIFVIDNSGSMSGPSMPQAKAALMLALERLQPDDTFNVIRFDDTMDVVFPGGAVPASEENVARAMGFVGALEATGGTEMLPALRAALVDANVDDDARVRQVVFLTDGAIGNEAELFEAIDIGLGRSRLFTVGIGSAPNTYFMSRAARLGRGIFTFIGDIDEVEERSKQLFEALERPVMTDLAASFPTGADVVAYPDPLPDLYAGEPVVLVAKIDRARGPVELTGNLAGEAWNARLRLQDASSGAGVSTLWARARIADLEEGRFTGRNWEDIDKDVLATALKFSLVSRLTSLVAIDVSPSRPDDAPIARADIPSMLPEGWDFDAVFGPEIEPFQREAALSDARFAALAMRADPGGPLVDASGAPLPQGSTTMLAQLALGLLLLIGGAALVRRRRRMSL